MKPTLNQLFNHFGRRQYFKERNVLCAIFKKLSKSLKMQKVHTKCKLVNLIKKSKGGVLILFHALIFRKIHKSHVPKQLFIFHSFAKFLLKFCSFFFKLVILNV